mgnify:CR=1 FL=1
MRPARLSGSFGARALRHGPCRTLVARQAAPFPSGEGQAAPAAPVAEPGPSYLLALPDSPAHACCAVQSRTTLPGCQTCPVLLPPRAAQPRLPPRCLQRRVECRRGTAAARLRAAASTGGPGSSDGSGQGGGGNSGGGSSGGGSGSGGPGDEQPAGDDGPLVALAELRSKLKPLGTAFQAAVAGGLAKQQGRVDAWKGEARRKGGYWLQHVHAPAGARRAHLL